MPPSAPTTPINLELEDEVESWDQVQEEGEMMQLRDEPNGDGDAGGLGPSETHCWRKHELSTSADSCQTASPVLVADLCEAWQDIHTNLSVDPVDVFGEKDVGDVIFHTRETNWVAQDMWEHFAQTGIYPNSNVLKQSRADFSEVYCSQDSQLTKHAQSMQMWAERHSLSDGDLTLPEGRKKLYLRGSYCFEYRILAGTWQILHCEIPRHCREATSWEVQPSESSVW